MGLVILIGLLLAACDPPSDTVKPPKSAEAKIIKSAEAKIIKWDVVSKIPGATYTQIDKAITIKVPYGTKIDPLDVDLPSVNTTATLETMDLTFTNRTAKDFIVKAQDGTRKTYKVIVIVSPPEITAFDFGADNKGTISQAKGEITFAKSFDYATWKKELTASKVEYFDNATLSFDPKTAKNYTDENKRTIIVSAKNVKASTKTYKIKVQIKVPDVAIKANGILDNTTDRDTVVYGEIKRMGGEIDKVFTGDLNHLDVSKVTNMQQMFYGKIGWRSTKEQQLAYHFNGNISEWDVSNITNMSSMFSGASSFNQDISSWKVKRVTNMSNMFYGASSFNQDISSWKVEHVTDMSNMFSEASSFNQDISSWKVERVTDMNTMFYKANSFNGNISSWKVERVTDMNYMFSGASSFNQDISSWKVERVTKMNYMFHGASSFNGNLSQWNVMQVIECSSFLDGDNTIKASPPFKNCDPN